MSGSCWIEVGPGQFDIDLFFIYFLKLRTGWLPLQKKKNLYINEQQLLLLAGDLKAHRNPVVVSELQHKNWACGSVINSVALFRVAPPAVSNNERDFGLYSHCLGVGYLLSCWGSVVFFGSSGTETVVVVVQDQRGSFQFSYSFSFYNSLNSAL